MSDLGTYTKLNWDYHAAVELSPRRSLAIMKTISREIFDQQRSPRFGNANPERMRLTFWEWMIRGDDAPPESASHGLKKSGLQLRDGKLKSSYGPYRARDFFNVSLNREDGPIWTFDRMGRTKSPLSDGRLICIGGEHEDFYDPDFFIYNDVVVFTPNDKIEVYGYPREVFPPTDFHSATAVDERILIIGGLGYKNERRYGHTPVYSLDLSTYQVLQIPTSGEMPGWISEHQATYENADIITISGGQLVKECNSEQQICRNFEDYALDLKSWVWRRTTARNWQEFSIRQEKGIFVLDRRPKAEALLPRTVPYTILPAAGDADIRFLVANVTVSLTIRIRHIELIVEGNLDKPLLEQLTEDLRSSTETEVGRRCTLSQV